MSSFEDRKKTGTVFNIQKYSVHDGPGIRTVVFLKGCPLRCRWCSNPESQKREPELAYNPNKCITLSECGRCGEMCTIGAISCGDDDRIRVDMDLCRQCTFACAESCPPKALIVYGQERSVDEVLSRVEQDSIFYSRSGGGMTLSGGEPLMQPDFALALLREARRRRIKTAIETCGHCDWEVLREACAHLNYVLFDIKCVDSARHKEFIKVPNGRILENFGKMCAEFPDLPVLVRTPVIPGFNDTPEDIAAILEVIGDRPNVSYEMLPYHRMAQPKYGYLGKEYPLKDAALADDTMQILNRVVSSRTGSRDG